MDEFNEIASDLPPKQESEPWWNDKDKMGGLLSTMAMMFFVTGFGILFVALCIAGAVKVLP